MEDLIIKVCNVCLPILLGCAVLTVICALLGMPMILVQINAFFILVDFDGLILLRALAKFVKEKYKC